MLPQFVFSITYLLLLLSSTQFGCASAFVAVQTLEIGVKAVGWPHEQNELQDIDTAVTPLVCALCSTQTSGESDVGCSSRLTHVGEDTLALHIYAVTSNLKDFFTVSTAFRNWGETNADPLLSVVTDAAIQKSKIVRTKLAKIQSRYSVPCRDKSVSQLLPICSTTENCKVSILITGLEGTVGETVCPHVPVPCESYLVSQTVEDNRNEVIIKDLANALEIVIAFVDDVRNGRAKATRVELLHGNQSAQLYASNEGDLYEYPIDSTQVCNRDDSLWLLLLLVLLFFILLVFRYSWRAGHRRSKKKERQAIIDDELRIQQERFNSNTVMGPQEMHYVEQPYTASGGGFAVEDYNAEQSRWQMQHQQEVPDYVEQYTPMASGGLPEETVMYTDESGMVYVYTQGACDEAVLNTADQA
ncbi:hypothetical protein ERJ75_000533700 [Trypanosoma vivax]|uniref:Uncharacterized protein n=1 Tax=Trypanosoma vivax (strain Y486) TaxID=1055687 RepID=G0TS67_TRYVY|nr:hypothetical protein TRVL_04077 [Trypanosoma vivax]KAH8615899.1 hypothetical protein ERJ75_000533700 [Trypanosoma vivax]CCC46792.1 conserved hypothetical protein [Trypanosoma vivax Y486]